MSLGNANGKNSEPRWTSHVPHRQRMRELELGLGLGERRCGSYLDKK